MLVEHLLELRLADCSYFLFDDLAALEQKYGRDSSNPVANGGLLVGVYVQLSDLNFSFIISRDLIDRGSHHAARPTPLGPEINQDRYFRIQNIFVEGCVFKCQRIASS